MEVFGLLAHALLCSSVILCSSSFKHKNNFNVKTIPIKVIGVWSKIFQDESFLMSPHNYQVPWLVLLRGFGCEPLVNEHFLNCELEMWFLKQKISNLSFTSSSYKYIIFQFINLQFFQKCIKNYLKKKNLMLQSVSNSVQWGYNLQATITVIPFLLKKETSTISKLISQFWY